MTMFSATDMPSASSKSTDVDAECKQTGTSTMYMSQTQCLYITNPCYKPKDDTSSSQTPAKFCNGFGLFQVKDLVI